MWSIRYILCFLIGAVASCSRPQKTEKERELDEISDVDHNERRLRFVYYDV